MKDQISELLSCISKEEFERFGDFVRSPYFNKLPRLVKLYEYLYENYSDVQNGITTRESISKFMYPDEEFKNESIRKLLSDFDKVLEKFTAQEEFENNEWEKKIYTLRGLRTRNCNKFSKRLKEYKQEHNSSNEKIDEYYETSTGLIEEEYEYWFSSNLNEGNDINQVKSDAIDNEFIAKKLFLFQYMRSREYVNTDVKYSYTFWEEIDTYIKKNKASIIKNDPELYRNYLGTQYFFSKYSEKALEKIKQFIDDQKYYERKVGKPYWDYINYCVIQANIGKKNYYQNVLSYLKLLDKYDITLEDATFNQDYFKIVITASINCKEFDWLEAFIHKYKNKLKTINRSDIVNLAFARLHFEKLEFNKAKLFAERISLSNYFLYIDAKIILFKIAYELNNLTDIYNIRDTFKKYLEAHEEIPVFYKQGKFEFSDYLIRLTKIKEDISLNNFDEYKLDEFIIDLNSEKRIISNSSWLKGKIDLLKK